MDEERLVIRQNLKGSYEKVNQVVSGTNFAHKKLFERCTWMRKYKWISFLLPVTQRNIN
jgi:hypothetical protein